VRFAIVQAVGEATAGDDGRVVQKYSRRVSSKLRTRLGFAVVGVLAILGLFVLGGVAAGVVLFATMLVFIGACISALRGEDPDSVAHKNRTGFAGWFGNWF
jgi:hypothetical protein